MTATIPPPPPPAAPPAGPAPQGPPPPPPARPPVPLGQRLSEARRSMRESSAAMSPAMRILVWSFGVFAAFALWLVVFGLFLSGLAESHAQSGLYQQFRGELAGGVAPLGGQIPRGDPVALLSSKDADIDNLVAVEGSSSSELRDGPGHYPGTVLPGQFGTSVIMGRSTTFGAPFAGITDLHQDSTIKVTTGQGTFTYVVQGVVRPGDTVPPALASGGSRLILATSGGGGWHVGWAPQYVVYAYADLKGKPVASPGTATIAAADDDLMKRDTSGMYPMVLWLQLLLVASVGGVWMRFRTGSNHAWLLAVPVGLAALWGASSEAWLLFPNLL